MLINIPYATNNPLSASPLIQMAAAYFDQTKFLQMIALLIWTAKTRCKLLVLMYLQGNLD